MRTRVIALLCVAVLISCSNDPGENGKEEVTVTEMGGSIEVPTNHADTWTALKAILEDAGYTVEVTGFAVTAGGDLSQIVATHKDGTTLDITLVPHDASGGTKVSVMEDGPTSVTSADLVEWIKNAQWGKVLTRLRETVGKG